MMSPPPPVAMAECGASRNMPERGRRGTEDEPLQCFEGRAKTTHTVRVHAGKEGRVQNQNGKDDLNTRCRQMRLFNLSRDILL